MWMNRARIGRVFRRFVPLSSLLGRTHRREQSHLVDVSKLRQEGLAWVAKLPRRFGVGDHPDAPNASNFVLYEDDREIGPAHAQHETIRRIGGGGYSHWCGRLYFSTSDGTDPSTNGRLYRLAVSPHESLSFPLEVYLETINACNARCPFCPLFHGPSPLDRTHRPATIMSWELFEKCAREIAAWPRLPATIYPHANGEPLQDPDFKRRLALFSELGIARLLNVHTNGQFLTDEMARAIVSAGVRTISVAFDGATKEVYEAHRVRCNYDRVLNNIKNFVHLRDTRNSTPKTQVIIIYVRTKENEHEVSAAYEMFSSILDPKLDEFHDKLSSDWGDNPAGGTDYFRLPSNPRRSVDRCPALENQLVIHSDGALAACCVDYNLNVSDGGFGNAKEFKLLELWRGEKRKRLSDGLRHGPLEAIPAKCKTCPVVFGEREFDATHAKIDTSKTNVGSFALTYHFDAS